MLIFGLPLGSVHSQLAEKLAECDAGGHTLADRQIEACTAAIQSGVLTEEQLAGAYKRRGRAYLCFLNGYDQAIRDLSEAIRLDPHDALTFYSRGDAYKVKAAKSSDEDTQKLAARALSDFSENIRLKVRLEPLDYINRSNAFVLLGQHERAIVDLNEALRIDPSDKHRALVNRCAAKLMLERLPEALADCDEAVRRQIYDYPLSVRALVYLKMGEYALSIRDSNAALPAAARLLPSVAQEVRRYGVR